MFASLLWRLVRRMTLENQPKQSRKRNDAERIQRLSRGPGYQKTLAAHWRRNRKFMGLSHGSWISMNFWDVHHFVGCVAGMMITIISWGMLFSGKAKWMFLKLEDLTLSSNSLRSFSSLFLPTPSGKEGNSNFTVEPNFFQSLIGTSSFRTQVLGFLLLSSLGSIWVRMLWYQWRCWCLQVTSRQL